MGFFFKESRKHTSSPANLHLDSSNPDLRKAARREEQAADCCCLGKGNPLGSGAVVSMGTALLDFAGPLGLVKCTERKTEREKKERVLAGVAQWLEHQPAH